MSYKSISREHAEFIVRRLLEEPIWASSSQTELAADVEADDDAALDILIRHVPDILPSLSMEDGQRLVHAIERLVDKVGAGKSNGAHWGQGSRPDCVSVKE